MTLQEMLQRQSITWHGVKLNAPDWGHESHTLAATTRLSGGLGQLHVIVNAYWEALEFEIPPPGEAHSGWRRIIDTSVESPDDVCAWADAPAVQSATYLVPPRSAGPFRGDGGQQRSLTLDTRPIRHQGRDGCPRHATVVLPPTGSSVRRTSSPW